MKILPDRCPQCGDHIRDCVCDDDNVLDFNALRSERAATIAEQYAHDTNLNIAPDGDGPFVVVVDLVADLLHYLATTGETNPVAAVNRAIDHYTEETK